MTNSILLNILGVGDPDTQNARIERADAAANRMLVLNTAARLFADRGVAAVAMADIAQAAGIGKGTLYRRYTNKAELCLALMNDQMAEFQNGMLDDMRALNADGVPYLDQLAYYMSRLVVFAEQHAPLLCEVERSGLLLENAHPELPHLWHSLTVTALLRSAQRHGEISPNIDVDYFAEALIAPLQADALRYQREVRGFTNERIVAGLRSLIQAIGEA